MNKLTLVFLALTLSLQAFAALKISTYNIRNFDSKKDPTNKKELARVLKSLKFDILQVEEIVNTTSFKNFVQKEFPGYELVLTKCGGGGRQKVGFLYNPTKFKLLKHYEDMRVSDPQVVVGQYGCGRLRPALVGIFQERKTRKKVVVIGVHLKAGGSETSFEKRFKQYEIIGQMLDELKLADFHNIIVLGDFNTTGFDLRNLDYEKFNDLLIDSKFETTGTRVNCTSYWSGMDRHDQIEEASILDHIIYPKSKLGYKRVSVRVGAHCARSKCHDVSSQDLGVTYKEVSDHCPVSATFY